MFGLHCSMPARRALCPQRLVEELGVLTFIKLGGSLITDKLVENSYRQPVAERIAHEIRSACDERSMPLLIGHGSGSFGHTAAKRYGTISGAKTAEEWRGFAEVSFVASELNYLVGRTLMQAGLSVLRIQPSASALAANGSIVSMETAPIRAALDHGLIPLVYGDVAIDSARGGTIISTEKIFFYLAHQLPVKRIFLLGGVDGVYDQDRRLIERITPQNFPEIEAALAGSGGIDVTGGMETKVRDMLALTEHVPGLSIRIFNGMTPGLLHDALAERAFPGTLISAS